MSVPTLKIIDKYGFDYCSSCGFKVNEKLTYECEGESIDGFKLLFEDQESWSDALVKVRSHMLFVCFLLIEIALFDFVCNKWYCEVYFG